MHTKRRSIARRGSVWNGSPSPTAKKASPIGRNSQSLPKMTDDNVAADNVANHKNTCSNNDQSSTSDKNNKISHTTVPINDLVAVEPVVQKNPNEDLYRDSDLGDQPEDVLNIMSILQQESSEAVQKRQILKLFDRFKENYRQLSMSLRESLTREQHLITTVTLDFTLNILQRHRDLLTSAGGTHSRNTII